MRRLQFRSWFLKGGWVAGGVLVSRASGFVREALIGAQFGTSVSAAILLFVLTLPDLLLGFFLGAAVDAVFIPRFQRLPDRQGRRLFWIVSLGANSLALLLSILLYFFAPHFLAVLAPGFSASARELAEQSLRIMSFSLPWISQSTVLGAFLQSRHHFQLPSLSSAFFNFAVILGLLFAADPRVGVAGVSVCAILGTILRCGVLFFEFSRNCNPSWTPAAALTTRRKGGGGRDYLFAMGTAALQVGLPTGARAVASLGGESFYALFSYGLKVIELPVGVLFSAISTVAFPRIVQDGAFSVQAEKRFVQATGVMTGLSQLTFCGMTVGLVGISFYWGKQFFWLHDAFPSFVVITLPLLATLPPRGFVLLFQAFFQARGDYGRVFFAQLIAGLSLGFFCILASLNSNPARWLLFGWGVQNVVLFFALGLGIPRALFPRWKRMLFFFVLGYSIWAVFYWFAISN